MDRPLMPKATAVWLVENTSLSFEQIATFCGLHQLEVRGIADGEVAQGVRGLDPVGAGMLSRDEIKKGEAEPKHRLQLTKSVASEVKPLKRKEPRYTPLSKRQDRPDAIAWLLRHHPEIPEAQLCKLLGTTKATVQAVRDRTHWKSQEIRPRDPVLLGLCTQLELDDAVLRAKIEHGPAAAPAPAPLPGTGPQPDVDMRPLYDEDFGA
ncbi:MAG: cell cycle transcriptional regulator TrcR [Geminicoccaceae bacterium]